MATHSPQKPSSQKRSLTSRIALFIAVILPLLGLAYAIARVDILRARIGDLRTIVTQQSETQTQQAAAVRELQSQLATQIETTTQLRDELRILSADRNFAATAATQARLEVLYLLRMAALQLQNQDVVAASINLRSVEQRVRGTPNLVTALPSVQQALSQLATYPQAELGQAALTLQALSTQALQLPVANLEQVSSTNHDTTWQRLQQALSKLFFIRRGGDTSSALLSAAEAQLAQQQLSVLLAQTRLSVLHHDQASYQSQLRMAQQALQQSFVSNDAAVMAMAQQLTSLASLNIAPTLPDLSATIALLASNTDQARSGATP